MTKTIAVVNQKGGVGKSVTTASLGIGLTMRGKKVLIVDADPQASLTDSLGYKHPDELSPTLCTLMEKNMNDAPLLPGEGILHQSEGVDLIPSNIELAGLEITLVNAMSRETVLRSCLNDFKEDYAYILIDCPPTLGMLTINAMTAADSLIIPCQSEYLSAKGLEQLLKSANRVRRQLNPSLQIDGTAGRKPSTASMLPPSVLCSRSRPKAGSPPRRSRKSSPAMLAGAAFPPPLTRTGRNGPKSTQS